MNMMTIVGRLVADPTLKELEDGKKVCNITVAVSRPFKNADGVYETDFFPVGIWNATAESTAEYCKKGDVVGIKGKLQSRVYETENKEKKHVLEVIADKVTFISSVNKKD